MQLMERFMERIFLNTASTNKNRKQREHGTGGKNRDEKIY